MMKRLDRGSWFFDALSCCCCCSSRKHVSLLVNLVRVYTLVHTYIVMSKYTHTCISSIHMYQQLAVYTRVNWSAKHSKLGKLLEQKHVP